MKKIFLIVGAFLCLSSLVIASEPRVFTDEDIEKYKRDKQFEKYEQEKVQKEEVNDVRFKEKTDQEYWCDRATKAYDRLERAQKALIDSGMTAAGTRARYGSRFSGSQAVATTNIESDKAKDEVRSAQYEVKRMEEDANRKNIPPGWLRCQF